MGSFVEKVSCPSCGSSDTPALAVYLEDDGTYNGSCFSCKAYFEDPYEGIEAPSERYRPPPDPKELETVELGSKIGAIPHRGLVAQACKMYGVRHSINESTGEVDKVYYPYFKGQSLVGYKVVARDKKMWSIGDLKGAQFFGQNIVQSGRMVIITESEADCLAAKQMLNSQGKGSYKVLSVPTGASARAFKDNWDYLKRFERIVLNFDMDESGELAMEEVSDLISDGRIAIMSMSEKDASDMLKAKKSKEYLQAVYNATTQVPDGVALAGSLIEDALKPIERGLPYAWPKLDDILLGIREGELIGIGGAPAAGKSQFCKELLHHLVKNSGIKVGGLFLEESTSMTLKQLAGINDGVKYHVPGSKWNADDLRQTLGLYSETLYLYQNFGANDYEAVIQKIEYMSQVGGCKTIFLDHLTALVAQEADETKAMSKIMEKIASLAQRLGIAIIYVSHLKKLSNGEIADGRSVGMSDFRGSGAISQWSVVMIGLSRNQQAETLDERNTVEVRILKDRLVGSSVGEVVRLRYDPQTGKMDQETPEQEAVWKAAEVSEEDLNQL